MAFAAGLLAALPAVAAAGARLGAGVSLSADERLIVASVQRHHDEDVALLEQLVNVNSGTLNLSGVTRIAELLRPRFESLGFRVTFIPMTELGRAGHLVAEHHVKSHKGKRVLMIAHLDTVFEADSPFQHFIRRGPVAEGPGTNDIKGGVVVILAALEALQDAKLLRHADVTVFLSGDEEKPGHPLSAARRDLIAAGKDSDLALDFEVMARSGGRDTIHIGRRSACSWKLTVSGVSGHSSGVGQAEGFGANYELARIVDEFRRTLPEPNLTFNTSLIAGGTSAVMNEAATQAQASGKDNIIAAEAVAAGDLRTLSESQTARIQGKMRDIVSHHLAGSDAHIEFTEGYPAMAPSAASQALFDRLSQVNADLGLAPLAEGDPATRGAGDIAFVAADVPGLVGMGVAGSGSHSVQETADLTSLDPQAERAAILIERLSR
jgi:glutamate carboxypeptidase